MSPAKILFSVLNRRSSTLLARILDFGDLGIQGLGDVELVVGVRLCLVSVHIALREKIPHPRKQNWTDRFRKEKAQFLVLVLPFKI